MNKKSIEVLRKEMGDQTVEPLLRKEDAEALCARYLERSLLTAPTQRTVASYMMEFYDWDTSPY
ncbi:MAG: integrase, partial [Sphaerochaeta sp.]|nr:integrase [Sphaerochaeta sp.]